MTEETDVVEVKNDQFATSRFNAVAHGILSQHTILPWEDKQDYNALVQSLAAEHGPAGATQYHLVEEIAGIIWRKRRLRMAEAAAHRKALDRAGESHAYTVRHALSHLRPSKTTDDVRSALTASPQNTTAELRSLQSELKNCRKLASDLESSQPIAFEKAIDNLAEGIRDWFGGLVEGRFESTDEYSYERVPTDLLRFLTKEALPWLESRAIELENRQLIKDQAFGASLNPEAMEKLARYEVHLDRKLEKSLGMLYRLKELSMTRPVSQNEPEVA